MINKNYTHKEVKSRLPAESAHYYSVPNLSYSLPYATWKTEMNKTVILHVVFAGV
jgi:hypothetical protein